MRFRVVHLLVAMIGVAVVMTLWHFASHNAALLALTVGSYAYLTWYLYSTREPR
jgi:hypothetical protein